MTLMSDARQICQKLLPTRTQLCKPVWKQRNFTYKVNALTFWILKVPHFEVLLNWSKGARNAHRDLCKSVAHMEESLQMVCLLMVLHVLHVLHILHWKPQIATSFMIRWWSSKGLRSYTWLRLKWRWICRTSIAAHIIAGLAWKDFNPICPREGWGAYCVPPVTYLSLTRQIHVRRASVLKKLDFSQLWVWKRAVRFYPKELSCFAEKIKCVKNTAFYKRGQLQNASRPTKKSKATFLGGFKSSELPFEYGKLAFF